MIWPAILQQEHVEGAKLYADRETLIRHIKLPANATIAEIGVAFGEFSRLLLDTFSPAEFHAFDVFTMHEWKSLWGKTPEEALGGRTHGQFYRDRFAGDDRVRIFEGDSSTLLADRPDGFYDLIYVDGDHEYEGVRKDAEAAVRKVSPGGVLVFNDYIMKDPITDTVYGVVQVVNDLCVNHGWRMTHFALQGALFCDVALRRT